MRKLALLVLAIILVSGCVGQAAPAKEGATQTPETISDATVLSAMPAGTGKIVFGITDKFYSLDGVTGVMITIGKVEIHQENGAWIAASLQPRNYDLLSLKGVQRFLADVNVAPGSYDQVRLTIGGVDVVVNGQTTAAVLPSSTFTLTGKVSVDEKGMSYVLLDFLPEQSLHEAGTKVVFAPVVNYKTWQETALTLSNGYLNRNDGHQLSDKTLGMDANGGTGLGLQISNDDTVAVDESGRITITRPIVAATKTVQISNYQFGPNSVSVSVGDTVRWVNNDDAAHTITADDGSFASGSLPKGGSFEHVFMTAGIFTYHCSIHALMKGTVDVE